MIPHKQGTKKRHYVISFGTRALKGYKIQKDKTCSPFVPAGNMVTYLQRRCYRREGTGNTGCSRVPGGFAQIRLWIQAKYRTKLRNRGWEIASEISTAGNFAGILSGYLVVIRFSMIKFYKTNWGYSLVTECLPHMCQAPGLILRITLKIRGKKRKSCVKILFCCKTCFILDLKI